MFHDEIHIFPKKIPIPFSSPAQLMQAHLTSRWKARAGQVRLAYDQQKLEAEAAEMAMYQV